MGHSRECAQHYEGLTSERASPIGLQKSLDSKTAMNRQIDESACTQHVANVGSTGRWGHPSQS